MFYDSVYIDEFIFPDGFKPSNCEYMFSYIYMNSDLDFSNWDMSSITTMKSMFNNTNVKSITFQETWNSTNYINIANMFVSTNYLSNLYNFFNNIKKIGNIEKAFNNSKITGNIVWDDVDCVINGNYGFDSIFNGSNIKSISMKNWTIQTTYTTSIYNRYSFRYCYNLQYADLSNMTFINNIDSTNYTINLASLFNNCTALTEINFSGFSVGFGDGYTGTAKIDTSSMFKRMFFTSYIGFKWLGFYKLHIIF